MAGKFRAIPTTLDGIKFHSRGESRRYEVLRDRQKAGKIADLRLQVPYELTVNGVKIARYIADFTYTHAGNSIVEDFKGATTPVFRLKAKLMKAVHGIDVRIVYDPAAD